MASRKPKAEVESEQAPEEPTESPESGEEGSDDVDVQPEQDDVVEAQGEASTGVVESLGVAYADPATDINAEARRRWIEANPDATVIPPTLLPPEYQDGTRVTPGMPS